MKRRRDKLIQLRKENGWLQKDIILLLKDRFEIEITESYYGMIEQGARTPKLDIALSIAKIFDVDPNEIFFDTEPNKNLGVESA
ncbi:helix-turn-helix transcriptional regulator [Neobacillus niacini]|uniref:helix-turn-helix transcriptional regulator n=1 Tax=Neobacillus niacini TaxID=86668 RepID=UPI002FFDF586